jgi:hypothetical protein
MVKVMGMAFQTYCGRIRSIFRIVVLNLKIRDHMGYIGIDGSIQLKFGFYVNSIKNLRIT